MEKEHSKLLPTTNIIKNGNQKWKLNAQEKFWENVSMEHGCPCFGKQEVDICDRPDKGRHRTNNASDQISN